jgi:hypothetical protein
LAQTKPKVNQQFLEKKKSNNGKALAPHESPAKKPVAANQPVQPRRNTQERVAKMMNMPVDTDNGNDLSTLTGLSPEEQLAKLKQMVSTLEKNGDCMFCYHCLDAKGIPVSYCDNEDCQMAIHLDCCK